VKKRGTLWVSRVGGRLEIIFPVLGKMVWTILWKELDNFGLRFSD
jgi:hypothetical protein